MQPIQARGDSSRTGRQKSALRGVAVLLAAIFTAEALLPVELAVGGLYILPVLAGMWLGSNRSTLVVAGLASALTLISLALAPGEVLWTGLTNRAVALFAIWITANLGLLRRHVEAMLVESRETTATTLKSIAEGVITTDAKGRVTFLNAAGEELLGWTNVEAEGRPLEEVFQRRGSSDGQGEVNGDAPAAAEAEQRLETFDTIPSMRETLLVTRSGRELPVESSTAPILDADDPMACRGRVLVFRDISERRRHQETVEDLAFRDGLTGLPNRNSFLDRLELELAHAKRDGAPLALLFLDLDGFKEVNDTLGHHAGDELLVSVGERLRRLLREGDTVARLGGDEFTVILTGVGSLENARKVAKKIVHALSEPHQVEGRAVVAAPSVGIALFPEDGAGLEELLKSSDHAMYRAKKRGGGRSFDWHEEGQAELFSEPPSAERDTPSPVREA